MSLPQFGRHASEILATYKHFLIYAQGDRSRFYLDLFTVLGAVITNTAMIWLMGKPLSLIQQGQYNELTMVLILFVIVVLINQSMQYTGGWLTKWLGLQFIGRTRNALLTRLLYLSFPVVEQTSRGDILARLSNDIEQISRVVVEIRIMLFSHVLTLSFYISMLFWINSTLALIALATTPLFFLQQRYFSPRRRHATENLLKRGGVLMGFEEQSLANLRGISSNRSESLVSSLHAKAYEKARKWAMRERSLDVGFMVSFNVLIYAVGLLIVLMGVELIKTDVILVGSLVSFLLYLGYLTVPVRGIADAFFQATGNVAAAERVLHMLEQKESISEKVNAKPLSITQGNIELVDVAFSYPNSQILFQKVDINIPGGATIALVGPSGSGKSTFATLLLRFYDPIRGRVSIDGQDLRDVSLASLRDNIAVVWQSPFLIVDTIRANLLMAKSDATNEEIQTACQRSHAWEFIQTLPQGLDTIIGQNGSGLSGGQAQRLAIAQAFLRDASILILDEASSALDSEAEQIIVKAIEDLRRDRTTLMIAHRYSSIRSADNIIYFSRDGSVIMSTHEELLENLPEYRDAVEWQTGLK